MSESIPTEADILKLSTFLRSLINQADCTNDYNLDQCNIPSPAAFEEVKNDSVEKAQSLSLSISSKSTIWDVTDISGYLADIQNFSKPDDETRAEELSKISDPEICTDTPSKSDDFSDISSNVLNNIAESPPIFPFNKIQGSPFNLFDVNELDRSTLYSNFFSNSKRHAAYYGEYPYSYDNGKTFHPAKPFSDNEYLQKIASYIQIVVPGVSFNSAMIHKYNDGKSFMPHHADNEEEIMDGSSIVTISFGESRFIEFQNNYTGSKICQKLVHGDVFIMEKSMQGFFTHSIPPDHKTELKPRLSVTFRLISAPNIRATNYSFVSSASKLSASSTVTGFLMDLDGADSPEGYVGDVIPSFPPLAESGLPTFSQTAPVMPSNPKLLDNIHPSRVTNGIADNHPNPSELRPPEQVLYISSSMFRNIDPDRLSSKEQKASRLFYPGADAARMLHRIQEDQHFENMQKHKINQIFILTGSNNIDNIHRNNSSIRSSVSDITKLLEFLSIRCPNATINVLNILPRQSYARCKIINALNLEIKTFCDQSDQFSFIDTYSNFMFSHNNGNRRNKFFMPPGQFGPDNVHLNGIGVVRLGKHLKYLAHQNYPSMGPHN